MRLLCGKKWLFLAGALAYTLLFYPAYQLWGHQLIAAAYQGQLVAVSISPAHHFCRSATTGAVAEGLFVYLWLTPLCTLLFGWSWVA